MLGPMRLEMLVPMGGCGLIACCSSSFVLAKLPADPSNRYFSPANIHQRNKVSTASLALPDASQPKDSNGSSLKATWEVSKEPYSTHWCSIQRWTNILSLPSWWNKVSSIVQTLQEAIPALRWTFCSLLQDHGSKQCGPQKCCKDHAGAWSRFNISKEATPCDIALHLPCTLLTTQILTLAACAKRAYGCCPADYSALTSACFTPKALEALLYNVKTW